VGFLCLARFAAVLTGAGGPRGRNSEDAGWTLPVPFWRVSLAALSSREPGEAGVRRWWLLGEENDAWVLYR
jgi:hypothetical protein